MRGHVGSQCAVIPLYGDACWWSVCWKHVVLGIILVYSLLEFCNMEEYVLTECAVILFNKGRIMFSVFCKKGSMFKVYQQLSDHFFLLILVHLSNSRALTYFYAHFHTFCLSWFVYVVSWQISFHTSVFLLHCSTVSTHFSHNIFPKAWFERWLVIE